MARRRLVVVDLLPVLLLLVKHDLLLPLDLGQSVQQPDNDSERLAIV